MVRCFHLKPLLLHPRWSWRAAIPRATNFELASVERQRTTAAAAKVASSSDCCHCSSPGHHSTFAADDAVTRHYVKTPQDHFSANSTIRPSEGLSIASTSFPCMTKRRVGVVSPFESGGMAQFDTRCKLMWEVGAPNFTANSLHRQLRSSSSYFDGRTPIAAISITVIGPTFLRRCQKAVTEAAGSAGFGQLDFLQPLL